MSAEAISIRKAEARDSDTIFAMLQALSREIGDAADFRAEPEAIRRHGFGPRPHFQALIAERARVPLGLAVYFPYYSTMRGAPGVYLQDLYVAGEARGAGLGRRLVAAVLGEARAWDAAFLKLAAYEDNAAARAFYGRLGFATDSREIPLWIEGADLGRLD